MKGQKTITFDFDFDFSENGTYVRTNEIKLTAPGLGKFHVHQQMRALIVDAMFGAAKRAAELQGLSNARKRAEEEEEDQGVRPVGEEPPAGEFLDQLALGLGPAKFVEFVDFAKRVLTDTPKLARVGEGNAPITDEVWEKLAELGGIEAINEVLGTFASFFVASPKSPRAIGESSDRTSVSPSRAASQSTMSTPRRSRS